MRRLGSLFAALAIVFALHVPSAHAQIQFRPGQMPADGADFHSQAELMILMGRLNARPEPWTPLPQARDILDEIAANGDLQDDMLKASWRQLGEISDALDAAWPDCEVYGTEGIQTQLDNLGRLGEDIRDRMNEIANIREGVAELYFLDLGVFEENIGELDDPFEIFKEGFTRAAALRSLRTVAERQGGSVASLGGGFVRSLGVFGAIINISRATVASYEAFRAFQRFPHLMEQAEMIAYLDALRPQYEENLDTINRMIRLVADTFPRACPCLPSRVIGEGHVIDPDPQSIGRRLDRIAERLTAMRTSGEFSGHRYAELEQEQRDLNDLLIAQARERRRAERAAREQTSDAEETRRRHKAFLDSQ